MHRPDVLRLFTSPARRGRASASSPRSGVSRDVVSRRVAAGASSGCTAGVYAIAGTTLTFAGRRARRAARCRTGRLRQRTDRWAPPRTARHADRLGSRSPSTRAREVLVPAPHRVVADELDRRATRDVQVRSDGIRVATPLRTLFGLARRFNQHRFERAAEDVWHKGLVTPDEAGATTSPRSASRASTASSAWSTGWSGRRSVRAPAQSGLELDFVAMIERVGLPTPVRQLPLTLPSGEIDPPRPRVARRPARRRTRSLVVARRRSPPAGRPGPRSGVRRGRLARPPLRRGGHRAIAPPPLASCSPCTVAGPPTSAASALLTTTSSAAEPTKSCQKRGQARWSRATAA